MFKNKRVKYQENPSELAFPVAYYVNRFMRESGMTNRELAKILNISEVELLDFLNEIGRQSRDFSHGKDSPSIL